MKIQIFIMKWFFYFKKYCYTWEYSLEFFWVGEPDAVILVGGFRLIAAAVATAEKDVPASALCCSIPHIPHIQKFIINDKIK